MIMTTEYGGWGQILCEVEGRPARGNIIASGEKGQGVVMVMVTLAFLTPLHLSRITPPSSALLRQKGSKVDRAFPFTFLG